MQDTKDLLLYESGNGGELALVNNDLLLGEQLYQQVYLALFGGNIEADTRGDELPTEIRGDWWGNSLLFADEPARQFNSETERALNSNPLTSTGRVNVQRAVEADLKYLKGTAEVAVLVALAGQNKVKITVQLTRPGNQQAINLVLTWDNSKKELITSQTI